MITCFLTTIQYLFGIFPDPVVVQMIMGGEEGTFKEMLTVCIQP